MVALLIGDSTPTITPIGALSAFYGGTTVVLMRLIGRCDSEISDSLFLG